MRKKDPESGISIISIPESSLSNDLNIWVVIFSGNTSEGTLFGSLTEGTSLLVLSHARQHVSELYKTLFVRNEKKNRQQRIRWWTDLGDGKVEKIIRQAQQLLPQNAEAKKKGEIEIHYWEKNAASMRYAKFCAHGLFVCSGVVGAGYKTLIGQRLKQFGME